WAASGSARVRCAQVPSGVPDRASLTGAARWILSGLAAVTAEADALFEDYEFGKRCETLYHFAWDEVFDWYLELAKAALPGPAGQTTREVLGYVLEALLRLLHPVIPFVTEELWTALTGGDTVVIAPWPGQRLAAEQGPDHYDPAAEAEIAALMRLVTDGRRV